MCSLALNFPLTMGAIPFMILLLSSCLFSAASKAFFFSSLNWSRVFTPPSPFRFSLTATGLAVQCAVQFHRQSYGSVP